MKGFLYVGVECGGTKFVVGVGTGPDDLRRSREVLTRTPAETIPEVVSTIREMVGDQPLGGIGLAAFGPVNVRLRSQNYGQILPSCPKLEWAGVNLVEALRLTFPNVAILCDTDVGGAALGEHVWGAGIGADPLVYLTVGTGIGGGLFCNSGLVHGNLHPEMGHVYVPRAPGDLFAGTCPSHGACLEGLASGHAIRTRYGRSLAELGPDHEAFSLVAHYLGYAVSNLTVVLSPQRIILGGGVMHTPGLIEAVRLALGCNLNGYLSLPKDYLVLPGLGDNAGVLGAIALIKREFAP